MAIDHSTGAVTADDFGSITGSSSSWNEGTRSRNVFLYSLVLLLEIIGIACIALVSVWADKYMGGFTWNSTPNIFNWHPVFMTVGLVFLYGNAAIAHRVFRRTEKSRVMLIHGFLHAAAFIFAVLGLYAVFSFHNMLKIKNVQSLHSWIGITTVPLYGCQLLFGCLGFLYPKLGEYGRRIYLRVHTYFGTVIFVLAIVAAIAGITEKLITTATSGYPVPQAFFLYANVTGVCLILFALLVGYILHNPDWKRSD